MKYLKIYEQFITELEVGNYICAEEHGGIFNKDLCNFIANNIGKCIKTQSDGYGNVVEYENIPKIITNYFSIDNEHEILNEEILY